ncbi:hypothetical protein M9458_055752 [Cirrhinus mrigala]|uniref:Reverse transcriptase domain-containing protein n=1 Tax=Cirrhinus mrigala TaxID=683832 RepID=A0ABD0MIL6_CIRMR
MEEVKSNLRGGIILNAQRLQTTREGTKVDSQSVVLQFEGDATPKRLTIGYMSYFLRPYVPKPLRCYNCQRFGHVAAMCKEKRRCARCGGNHNYGQCGEGVLPKCCNCGGEHNVAYGGCKVMKEAVQVQKVRMGQNVSYAEAVKMVRNQDAGSRSGSIVEDEGKQIQESQGKMMQVNVRKLVTFIAGVINGTAEIKSKTERIQLIVMAAERHLDVTGLTWEIVRDDLKQQSTQPSTPCPSIPPTVSQPALKICEGDVCKVFRKQKIRKAKGPDGVSPACLKACAVQLSSIFTLIFNRSLELCLVPSCFKCSTIIPVPKKPKTTGLNDYRPVALTSVVMKSFERLVLAYLKDITGPLLDPLQFAYRANRSVDDAVNVGLHYILQHLDKPGTYARILFVDFSSAFNTIIPDILQIKLSQLSVPTSICQWITNFLTDRQQLVRLGKLTSGTRTISTGAPQGCVLSPLLFSLYTNDCTSKDPSVKLLKFADDTTVIGLIRDGDESAYRQEVEQLSLWCSHNNLELNTLKTVEMTVDFRRKPPALPPLTIMNSTVAAVDSFKFLGTNISQDLKWDIHIDSIVKKAQQRLYFLRQLKKFDIPQK